MHRDLTDLECFVCVEVEGKPAVWEEEMQAPKIEKIIAANLLGKGFHGSRVEDRV